MKKWLAICLLALLALPGIAEEETMRVTVGEKSYTAVLADNETARAFAALLPMTLDMTELNGNEKYHYLMGPLPAEPQAVRAIETGDILLFGDDCVVVFYDSFTTPYSYTRIGKITDPQGLREALGEGTAAVAFALP